MPLNFLPKDYFFLACAFAHHHSLPKSLFSFAKPPVCILKLYPSPAPPITQNSPKIIVPSKLLSANPATGSRFTSTPLTFLFCQLALSILLKVNMKSAINPAANDVDHCEQKCPSAFPKACRSSRAKGENHRRSNNVDDCSEDMHFFELLALVAGQVLEEEQKFTYKAGSVHPNLSPARSSKESVGEKDAVCNLGSLAPTGNQMQAQEVVSKYTEERCISSTINSSSDRSSCGLNGKLGVKTISNSEDPVFGIKQTCCVSSKVNVAQYVEEEINILDNNHSPLGSSTNEGQPASKQSEVQLNGERIRSQEKSCLKVLDEDQNSSESTVFKMVKRKPSRLLKALKSLDDAKKAAANTKDSSSSVKRKHTDLIAGEIHKSMHRVGKASRHQQATLEKIALNAFPDRAVEDDIKSPASKLRRVKLTIGSFLVPELSIELPESATVANLKKAVMEAALNLLGGGLDVRVLLQDEKISDETVSLLGAGIVSNEHSDSLRFMLEPTTVGQVMAWYPGLSSEGEGIANGLNSVQEMHMGGKKKFHKEDGYASNDVVMSGTYALTGSQAGDALAVVPFDQTMGSPNISKRRTRRPFSVAEVEALVQAVEKLGTGRWRDVKLHAFGNAEHRTYVDLKDKWKTLVHTASIAPYQRRGEPVPQQLLDRVTNAHAYWTAHQVIKGAG